MYYYKEIFGIREWRPQTTSVDTEKQIVYCTTKQQGLFALSGYSDQVLLPEFYRRGHRIYLIQDNAFYHKKAETYKYFSQHRRYLEVFQLPRYWPELNATERIWNYTRKHATHNRYFETPKELRRVLFRTFGQVRRYPEEIEGLLKPFF